MTLPVVIPNEFANATASIPLSQLDSNFSTLANVVNEINAGTQQLANANVAILIVNAGTSAAPTITTTGDTNTGIFFPAADTIAFAEGGAEAMRIDSSGNVGIGTDSPAVSGLEISRATGSATPTPVELRLSTTTNAGDWAGTWGRLSFYSADTSGGGPKIHAAIDVVSGSTTGASSFVSFKTNAAGSNTLSQRAVLSSNGFSTNEGSAAAPNYAVLGAATGMFFADTNTVAIATGATERARITSGGEFLVGKTSANQIADVGFEANSGGVGFFTASAQTCINVNRKTNDGVLIQFWQDTVAEGNISVSGNTVSYNAFSGGHWTQLTEGRGYNPEIPRGTVMSTIGEMCEWKSVEWTETTEHPAIPAVEAKEAVLDEEGNVIEPAVEAVEGKDAWTETSDKRESYLGDLPVGATFEEDGFTKTVVDDGNERLPKVKISDVVGDKAVYGVFQTWDDVQDMLVTSLGAFVVRIAAGVTVEIGDLLESNGDGCAKVQDDDVIRSKTIAKVTSTTPTATYDDGSYTVPAVIYCG